MADHSNQDRPLNSLEATKVHVGNDSTTDGGEVSPEGVEENESGRSLLTLAESARRVVCTRPTRIRVRRERLLNEVGEDHCRALGQYDDREQAANCRYENDALTGRSVVTETLAKLNKGDQVCPVIEYALSESPQIAATKLVSETPHRCLTELTVCCVDRTGAHL